MPERIRSFEDLQVWQACREVRLFAARFTAEMSHAERRRMGDQMIRAARSTTANIAEGYGRFHYQENIQYCRQARGSLCELLDHFICAVDEGLATAEELNEVRVLVTRALRVLNGYINYLRSAKDERSRTGEEEAGYEFTSEDGPQDDAAD